MNKPRLILNRSVELVEDRGYIVVVHSYFIDGYGAGGMRVPLKRID